MIKQASHPPKLAARLLCSSNTAPSFHSWAERAFQPSISSRGVNCGALNIPWVVKSILCFFYLSLLLSSTSLPVELPLPQPSMSEANASSVSFFQILSFRSVRWVNVSFLASCTCKSVELGCMCQPAISSCYPSNYQSVQDKGC